MRINLEQLFRGASKFSDEAGRCYLQFDLAVVPDMSTKKMVIGLRGNEPCPIDNNVPTYWVTAPTQTKMGLGVVVNAKFDLDSGRARLYKFDVSPANRDIAKEMAERLFEVLQASTEWQILNEDPQQRHQFYQGLWNVFSNKVGGPDKWDPADANDSGIEVIRRIIWGTNEEKGGYRQFIEQYEAVPTGIAGDSRLFKVGDISHFVLDEIIGTALLSAGDGMVLGNAKFVSQGSFERINQIFGLNLNVEAYDWTKLFNKILERYSVLEPRLVNGNFGAAFCEAINRARVVNRDLANRVQNVQYSIRECLAKFQYRSVTGEALCPECMLGGLDAYQRDEARRVEEMRLMFVPDRVKLNDDYQIQGQKVFAIYRDVYRGGISQENLSNYAVDAVRSGNEDRLRGVLSYVAAIGGDTFCDNLRTSLGREWCEALLANEVFNGLMPAEKFTITGRLQLPVDWQRLEGNAGLDVEPEDPAVVVSNSEKYTYAWVKACVALELKEQGGDADNVERRGNREATVVFHKMECDTDARYDNAYILSMTDSIIPEWFAEEVDQKLVLKIRGRPDHATVIRRMSVDQCKLKIELPNALPNGLDVFNVYEAKTSATKPKFLMSELYDRYDELSGQFCGEYDFRLHLPQNLRFVFGPPGTGKTTHLAKNEILPLMMDAQHYHVLVLTPTNKAADVITEKLVEKCTEAKLEYTGWLTRFGTSLDPILVDSAPAILRDKDVNVVDNQPCTVVTTIIRFAYDKLRNGPALRDISWDYIIIDEASMIPVMQIIYPLIKAGLVNPDVQFIVAGDPFQIEPVVKSEPSKGENIYKMVGLTSFMQTQTETRHAVAQLKTQWRSIPEIVRIISEFKYDGAAGGLVAATRHDVDGNDHGTEFLHSARCLNVDGIGVIAPLTMLRFPVDRCGASMTVRKVAGSSYHIYASLFLYKYIDKLVHGVERPENGKFRIGIISPYRTQADIMRNLLEKIQNIPDYVDLQANTVHGFQGDECDLIIAFLNPPKGMGWGGDKVLINNSNLINVAISRAKSYLVVALPTENSMYYERLRGNPVGNIEGLVRQFGDGNIPNTESPLLIENNMADLEEVILGEVRYIEGHTRITGHQNVNVYSEHMNQYEVFASEDAVDIQVNDGAIEHVTPPENQQDQDAQIAQSIEHARESFWKIVNPDGYHRPGENEELVLGQKYYLYENPENDKDLRQAKPQVYDDVALDMSDMMDEVVAIQDVPDGYVKVTDGNALVPPAKRYFVGGCRIPQGPARRGFPAADKGVWAVED